MAIVTLVEATPLDPATAAPRPLRLAGGGRRHYTHRQSTDWLAGVVARPRFAARLDYDAGGVTGGSVPTVTAIGFMPARAATLRLLARLAWTGAPIVLSTGDDDADAPVWAEELRGTVAGYAIAGGMFQFTVSSLARGLDKPLAGGTFAGTGGLEGGADATGRVKRRSWGPCWNVPGFLLDAATNIHEFGDPAIPLQGFDAVKDRGRMGPVAILGWQGSAEATLAALRASAPVAGGGVAAPSIACVKWWRKPSGPLTADLRGAPGLGGAITAPAIAARIALDADVSAPDDLAAVAALRPDEAGHHVADGGETGASALNQLLLRASLAWAVTPVGGLRIAPIGFGADRPVVAIDGADREAEFAPVTSVSVGYRRNHRRHSDAEISAAVAAADVTYADGATAEAMKPAQPGADVTRDNTSKDTAAVGGRPAIELLPTIDRIPVIGRAQELLDGAVIDLDRFTRQIDRQRGTIEAALMRAVVEAGYSREVMRGAGIVVDPDSGQVRISAVDRLAERQLSAEIVLDATKALVTTKVDAVFVNQQIAAAQLNPADLAALTGLITRVTSAEQRLDGLAARIDTKAEAVIVTNLVGTVSIVAQTLDALAGVVSTKAEKSVVDGFGIRLGSVEQTIATLGDVSSYAVEVRQARYEVKRAGAANLAGVLAAFEADNRQLVAAASAREELIVRMDDGDAVLAGRIVTLVAKFGDFDARLVVEQQVRASQVSALAEQTTALGSALGGLSASVAQQFKTLTDAQGAEASARQQLRAELDPRITSANDAAVAAKAAADGAAGAAGAADRRITAEVARLDKAVVDEAGARASAQSDIRAEYKRDLAAEARRADGTIAAVDSDSRGRDNVLGGRADAADADRQRIDTALLAQVSRLDTAVADERGARARAVTEVMAKLGNLGTATVQDLIEALIDQTGKIMATRTTLIDVNGNLVGTQLVGSASGRGSLNLINADLRMGTGRVIFDTGAVMMVQGLGFGANRDLILWFGPSMPIASCTRANGTIWLGVDNKAYFGGGLSAGVLQNARQSTDLAADASVLVGPFGTKGGRKTVVATYGYYLERASTTSGGGISGQPAATLVVERRVGSGGWEEITRFQAAGTTEYQPAFNAEEPGYGRQSTSGSVTITDTTPGTNDCSYRLRLISRTLAAFNFTSPGRGTETQTLSIQSIEE